MDKGGAILLGMLERSDNDGHKQPISASIAQGLYDRMKEDAKQNGCSISDYLRAGIVLMLNTPKTEVPVVSVPLVNTEQS